LCAAIENSGHLHAQEAAQLSSPFGVRRHGGRFESGGSASRSEDDEKKKKRRHSGALRKKKRSNLSV